MEAPMSLIKLNQPFTVRKCVQNDEQLKYPGLVGGVAVAVA